MLKKQLILILIFALVLSLVLVGCGKQNEDSPPILETVETNPTENKTSDKDKNDDGNID